MLLFSWITLYYVEVNICFSCVCAGVCENALVCMWGCVYAQVCLSPLHVCYRLFLLAFTWSLLSICLSSTVNDDVLLQAPKDQSDYETYIARIEDIREDSVSVLFTAICFIIFFES